jgi:hypothetical protein
LPPIAPATTSIGKTNRNGLTPPGQTDASPAPKSNTADKAALR